MSETFDPPAAKQIFGRITVTGSLGDIAGGLMAERIAALVSASRVLPPGVLLPLAALLLSCSIALAPARRAPLAPVPSKQVETVSLVTLFRRAPYLSLIALIVLAGTASAAIIDYLFQAGARIEIGQGAPLFRFFPMFYTLTQILTLLAQTLLASRALDRLGISRTISALPAGVGAGALGALLVPDSRVIIIGIRSLELILRGSFYRAAYELVYTPVPAAEKRAAKTLIDVAVDRAGDALGGGMVQFWLWLGLSHSSGLLVDHLTNPDVEFSIRRRIPRILARCDSQLAVYGLIAGLADTRFEVRFRCSRALDALVQHRPSLKVPTDAVFAAVERELQVAHPIWNSRRLLDKRDGSDPDAFLDQILRERANQSLEHIFSLLATVLPREPVKVACRALHTDDKALRGLAAEYLGSVLPANLREQLWAMVEPRRAAERRAPVSSSEAMDRLLRSHESLMILLKKGDRPS